VKSKCRWKVVVVVVVVVESSKSPLLVTQAEMVVVGSWKWWLVKVAVKVAVVVVM